MLYSESQPPATSSRYWSFIRNTKELSIFVNLNCYIGGEYRLRTGRAASTDVGQIYR
jgi:hypothetical protein